MKPYDSVQRTKWHDHEMQLELESYFEWLMTQHGTYHRQGYVAAGEGGRRYLAPHDE